LIRVRLIYGSQEGYQLLTQILGAVWVSWSKGSFVQNGCKQEGARHRRLWRAFDAAVMVHQSNLIAR
jgi:hypothetical protein